MGTNYQVGWMMVKHDDHATGRDEHCVSYLPYNDHGSFMIVMKHDMIVEY